MSGVSTPNRAENTSQERPAGVEPFSQALTRHGYELTRAQINTGLACNHCCRHCHLDAGPARWEMMDLETMQPVVDLACRHRFAVIDITGGAPELNEHLGFMVEQLAPWTPRIMLRSNLTAISTTGRKSLIDHEEHFRKVLQKKWGIVFNHLCSFSNVPLGRFRQWLLH
jgi:sulfatase maturation enzyme AslB (radical SAM superfamily)